MDQAGVPWYLRRFAQNPYHTLCMGAGASQLDIHHSARSLKLKAKVAQRVESPWSLPWLGPAVRDEASLDLAVGLLSRPTSRLEHRMYWFCEGATLLSTVTGSSARAVADGWWTAPRPTAHHDGALMSVLAAAVYDPQVEDEVVWLVALQRWQEAHSSTEYRNYVREIERTGGFPVEATDEDADEVFGRAAGVVGAILGGIARDSIAAGDAARCARALHVLRRARYMGLSLEEVARLEDEVVGPLEDGLESRCKALGTKCNVEIRYFPDASADNRAQCELLAAEYNTEVSPRLSMILQIVDPTSDARERVRSAAASCLRAIAVAWTWADQFRTAEDAAKQALGLAIGTPLEADLRELVKSLRPAGQSHQQRLFTLDDGSSSASAEKGREGKMPQDLNEVHSADGEAEPSVTGVRPWIRYWARFIDISWGATAVQILLLAVFPQWFRSNLALVLVSLLGFVPVEAALMTLFGTTPGKWLLNVSARREDGSAMDFKVAFRRGLLVWWRGLGTGFPIVGLITLITAHDRLKKTGSTSWDDDCGCAVIHGPVGVGRGFAAGAIIVAIFVLRVWPWS